jgi:hypothetical protein
LAWRTVTVSRQSADAVTVPLFNTVKSHLSTNLRKYGMENRGQVADDVRKHLSR